MRRFRCCVDSFRAKARRADGPSIGERLQSLSPRERQILLLTSVEGFTLDEAAYVSGETPAAAAKLLGKDEQVQSIERAPRSARRIFGQGVIVNVLNPKTALFFLAFVPQFVDPDRPVWTQTIALGLCWVALGLLSDGAYALAGGTIGGVLRRRRKAVRYASGGIFVGLGAVAATS